MRKSKFKRAADAAQDAAGALRATGAEGRGKGIGQTTVRDSWLGKNLNRQNESRPPARAACDKLRDWRKKQQEERAEEEATRRAAEEAAREARLRQAQILRATRKSRAAALG